MKDKILKCHCNGYFTEFLRLKYNGVKTDKVQYFLVFFMSKGETNYLFPNIYIFHLNLHSDLFYLFFLLFFFYSFETYLLLLANHRHFAILTITTVKCLYLFSNILMKAINIFKVFSLGTENIDMDKLTTSLFHWTFGLLKASFFFFFKLQNILIL